MKDQIIEKLNQHRRVADASWIETTYSITLKPGWRHWELNGHVIMANTLAEVKRQLREVEPCKCEECEVAQ